jgi:hypothetical protein
MAKISKERKATYYIGLVMMVIGLILFFSVFVSVAVSMANPTSFSIPPFQNGIFGFILTAAGGVVMSIGAKGAAGSGLLLDPEKAREDLKPFNEARGEMINDVISNIGVVEELVKPHEHEEKEIIKLKCRSCGTLNDEDAKFCKGCGGEL